MILVCSPLWGCIWHLARAAVIWKLNWGCRTSKMAHSHACLFFTGCWHGASLCHLIHEHYHKTDWLSLCHGTWLFQQQKRLGGCFNTSYGLILVILHHHLAIFYLLTTSHQIQPTCKMRTISHLNHLISDSLWSLEGKSIERFV